MSKLSVSEIPTTPFAGQKPGTSGLRKRVSEFMTPHYMENFLACTMGSIQDLAGSTLVVGGDGRYGVKHAVNIIIQMAAANGVRSHGNLPCLFYGKEYFRSFLWHQDE
jgi:phosphoglucomutase